MDWTTYLLEIFKYTAPVAILAVTVIYIVRSFMQHDQQLRLLESKVSLSKDALIIRLQAYERMALLLERMHPASLIQRVSQPGMTAKDLQFAMTSTIQIETEHNFAQQIYISADAWNLLQAARGEIIKMINIAGQSISASMTASQFADLIMAGVQNARQPLPSQIALDFLKAEAKDLL